jgi:hypothetical protein
MADRRLRALAMPPKTRSSTAKTASAKAKEAVREALNQLLNQGGDIDFTDDGQRIRVFENLRKTGRARMTDLSFD